MPARAQIARLAALVAAIALILPAAATAASQDGNYDGQFRGVVQPGQNGQPPRAASRAAQPGDLTWHGGPVMHSNNTHIVYWEPAGSTTPAAYKTMVQRYMTDVAAASGRVDNVYAADAQYTDSTGPASYSSTFAGALVDTTAYPASGCTHPNPTIVTPNVSVCLSDSQIRTELNNFMTANNLPRGLNELYFVLTPAGVGSCFDSSSCSYTQFCAYHSDFGAGVNRTPYAMQPWADVSMCDVGDSPNGNSAADNVINLISHEHNESITDPFGNGWWDDLDGKENGDKCAWTFTPWLGGSAGSRWNQLINSNPYALQLEWSNSSHGCVLNYDPPPNAAFTFSPPSPGVNQVVTFDGTGSSDVPGPISNYAWTFGDGATATGPNPTHAYASPGTYLVRLTVTGSGGATNSVTHNVIVPGAGGAVPSPPSTPPTPSPPPGTSSSPPPPPVATPAARPTLALPALITRVTRNRRTALVRVTCGTPAACSGSVTIYGRVRGAHGAFRSLFLGLANFSLGAGRSAIVRVPLTLRAAGLLANGRRVSATVRASARGATPVSVQASLRAS